jgi:membrane protein implicated in regulation of membrane protease activity
VVLFSRISAVITSATPALDDALRLGLIRDVASGDLSGSGIASASRAAPHVLALQSFAEGYTALFAASAVLCLIAAMLCWRLVRASDTPPIAKKQRRA